MNIVTYQSQYCWFLEYSGTSEIRTLWDLAKVFQRCPLYGDSLMYIYYSIGNNSGPWTLVRIVEVSVIGGVRVPL